MGKNIECPYCHSDLYIDADVSSDDIDISLDESNSIESSDAKKIRELDED